MKSITRNKLLIEGWPADEIVEIGLQQHCKGRECIVIWQFVLGEFQEAVTAVLSEEIETDRCTHCSQVIKEGKCDGEFDNLIRSSSVMIVFCNNLELATHVHQNLMEEMKKIGLHFLGRNKSQPIDECYRTCEVWSDGKQILPKKEVEK